MIELLATHPAVEPLAVAASTAYILLASLQQRSCWLAAMLGSALYVAVFWHHRLLMDALLNVYYVAMAVYGWIYWQRGTGTDSQGVAQPIIRWQASQHVLAWTAIAACSLASGYWLANNTDAAFPYLDSLTTWASLLCTWMVVRKVLENWLYWIAIDTLAMWLYWQKGLYPTVALFGLYLLIAVFGYWMWRRSYDQQIVPTATASAATGPSS